MTPTADMPTDTLSPDLEAKMDAAFAAPPAALKADSAGTSGTLDENITIEPADYDYYAQEAPPQPAAGEQPQDGTGQQEEQAGAQGGEQADIPAGDEDDEIDLSKLDPNLKVLKVDRSRFNNILQGHKFSREIRDFAPSVEAAREHYQQSNDFRDMHADYTSGTPQGVDKFLEFWRNESPQAYSQMASRALATAPREFQEQIADSVLRQTIENRYVAALQSGDQNELWRARKFDYEATGKWRTDEQLAGMPKPDPYADRQRELDERQRTLDQRDQQAEQQRWQQWDQGTRAAITQSLKKAIDETLKPVETKGAYKPAVLEAIKANVLSQLLDKVKEDREFMRGFNRDYGLARRNPTQETRKSLVDTYSAKASLFIRPIAKPLLSEATTAAIAQNRQQHADRARSQDRREVSSGGRPAPVRAVPGPAAAPMTLDQKMNNFWANIDRQQSQRSR